jgi:hypothetical protein
MDKMSCIEISKDAVKPSSRLFAISLWTVVCVLVNAIHVIFSRECYLRSEWLFWGHLLSGIEIGVFFLIIREILSFTKLNMYKATSVVRFGLLYIALYLFVRHLLDAFFVNSMEICSFYRGSAEGKITNWIPPLPGIEYYKELYFRGIRIANCFAYMSAFLLTYFSYVEIKRLAFLKRISINFVERCGRFCKYIFKTCFCLLFIAVIFLNFVLLEQCYHGTGRLWSKYVTSVMIPCKINIEFLPGHEDLLNSKNPKYLVFNINVIGPTGELRISISNLGRVKSMVQGGKIIKNIGGDGQLRILPTRILTYKFRISEDARTRSLSNGKLESYKIPSQQKVLDKGILHILHSIPIGRDDCAYLYPFENGSLILVIDREKLPKGQYIISVTPSPIGKTALRQLTI